jgi:UDP-N-acetylmuramate-alanine ligase
MYQHTLKKHSIPTDILEFISDFKNDILVTIGAGDIDRLVQPIKEKLNTMNNEKMD